MTQFWEYVKMALMNIRSNKGRSILTMLGIIIGISSVIMVISIGNGVSSEINSELNQLAGGQLAFYSDDSASSPDSGDPISFDMDTFTEIEEKIDHVKGVSPKYTSYGSALGPKGDFTAYLYGGTEALQYVYSDPIIKGRYFTRSDYEAANRVCIIRESSAIALFGTTDVIGNTFDVDVWGSTVEMTVIGVRKDAATSAITSMFMYFDDVEMELPLTTMGSFGFYIEDFSLFYVFTDGPEYATKAAAEIMQLLRTRYRVPPDSNSIQMQDFNDQMGSITRVLSYITVFVVFVAAISLLVGGIGVMNIMLVSVTERTREIGIRKSLGARTKSIMLQFLSESAIITMIGGIIGIIIGVLGAKGVCSLMGFHATVSPLTVIVTTLFSSSVGIFFGIYPAKKAAKMSPIDALRHE